MRFVLLPALLAFDVVGAIWVWSTFGQGLWLVGSLLILVLAGINVAVIAKGATAFRWMLPTLVFMLVFTLAPIVYTGFIALTNYNGNHLLTQQQAYSSFERQTHVPDGTPAYAWAAYEAEGGGLALYLIPQLGEEAVVPDDLLGEEPTDGESAQPDPEATPSPTATETEPAEPTPTDPEADEPATGDLSDVFATAGGEVREATAGTDIFGAPDANGFPATIDGYTRLDVVQAVTRISELSATSFGAEPTVYRVISGSRAAAIENVYDIDRDAGTITDRRDGTVYSADPTGYFIAPNGDRLTPAYQTVIGIDNFVQLFGNEKIRGPFLEILLWTLIFAVVVVVLQFALGLLYAVVINSRFVNPVAARVVRAVLLLPYVIPAYLMILVWAALFNQQTGLITAVLDTLFGLDPSWINDGNGARLAMLVVGLWLGFPYFLLINTGALQAVPGELLEAAEVDGAGVFVRFQRVVLPLLLRSIAPLIVLAAAFNFNNFLLAYLLFGGNPPKLGAQVPAGETDLLISFTYKLSFDFGNSDYALAAAVTVLIFLALTPIVVSQLRYYNSWRGED
ncbi:hypothetical protein GCM10011600_02210 [Pseudolysinimonas yzui]|uniref:Maltose/maltodextrin transport system permease protein n=1 Tax=Pseudolysinimonas yzui TaxID=2708254 RepID=A0A8J3DZM8_9MICO|nr:hypothetical protein GCM10011600_02210 [Pseudolysinimonas yzui]